MENDVAIVVSSYDKNKKFWNVAKHSFAKYWLERPYHIYFITNFEKAPAWYTVNVGEEKGFSANTIEALKKIPCDIIVWTLDDYWFTKPVNNELLKKYIGYVKEGKADYIRLFPSENADREVEFDNSLHYFNDDCMYKTSMGMAIWRKSVLQRLLVPEENIWQFEQNSAKRTLPEEKYLTVINNDCIQISSLLSVLKGEITEEGYKYIKEEGITL